jgi:hypothetical protein
VIASGPQTRVPQVSLLRPRFLYTFAVFIFAIACFAAVGNAQTDQGQKLPWQIGSSDLAGRQNIPVIFLSPVEATIPAGKASIIDLHFRIEDGLHINSHRPHDASLIATQLLVADSTGVNTTGIDFPEGTDTSFVFAPDQKLSVYTGEVVLHAHITARAGQHEWQGILRYQACNNSQCLPPRKVPVGVEIIAK